MSQVGEAIRKIRKSKGFTQLQLSKLTGFNQNTISNHERGNRSVDEIDINIYAHALGVSPKELFTSYNDGSDDILDIYNQLISKRKENVINYAKWQLNEQNNVIELSNYIHEEKKMNLGEIIKQYRDDNKLSMDKFAKMSGVSKAYISVLEKNKRPKTGKPVTPSISIVKNIAKAMNISFDELFNMLEDN